MKFGKSCVILKGSIITGSIILLSFAVSFAQQTAKEEHESILLESRFPSSTTCRTCHPDHYREWSVSAHAYTQMSPVFNAMHGTILKRTNGTNGDFCIRCHNPVGMNLNEPEFMYNIDRHPTSREGVTCVVCHRLKRAYGRVSGRLAIVEGDIFEPVYGPSGNQELKRVIESGDYNVNAQRGKAGRSIHTDAIKNDQISTSAFCSTCHDVNLVNGFRLEEAFSDYKTSPASKNGETCQDCHMGKEPGKASGYDLAPVALVGGKPTKPRKRTNHMFAGPDYSVIHPGIFPHNSTAAELATLGEWLTFDTKAGWGTDEFEDNVPEGYEFPPHWTSVDDRYDAREIIEENLQLLNEIEVQRLQVLRAGYQLGDIVVEKVEQDGIKYKVQVRNGMNGHSVPTGFDGERVVFLQVTVSDSRSKVIFKSGDLDPNGDLRDSHSLYVHNGELPMDEFLFNLQSKFVVRMVRGGEREEIIPVNYSPSPLPFLRPSTVSTLLLGRPVAARKHRQVLPPLAGKWAKYEIKSSELAGSNGPYKANIKLIAGMIPVNLVDDIKDIGFDYGLSARDLAESVLAGHLVLWERNIVLEPGKVAEGSTPPTETRGD